MQKILISNPSSMYITFLPYIHGLLKVYAQTEPILAENYEWLKPIYLYDSPQALLRDYDLTKIDVLGLSCYVWNFAIQCEIARLVKEKNPQCLVVVGGPEPDWNDQSFFKRFPMIDIVVTHDGEIPFNKILAEKLKGTDAQYSKIAGVITQLDGVWSRVYAVEKLKSWPETSPYCDDPQMREIIQAYPANKSLAVIWETNRGCPYGCVFCDWGSNVSTKIRAFPESKIAREAKWFSENEIERVYITDANFGILPRDEIIIDQLCERKSVSQWPKIIDWCAAKNNIERITSICLKLNAADLNRGVLIGYQSTNSDVLSAMSRLNMGEARHRQMVEQLKKENVHIFAAIILGSPEDTKASFRKSIHDLLDLGFDDSIRCYLYALLPNAPANDPAYREKYGIKTKKSKIVGPVKSNVELDSPFFPRIDYIVKHNKMTSEDWIDNCQYYGFISGLHNLGLTRHIAKFLKLNFAIGYADFYSGVFDYFKERPETVLGHILSELDGWLSDFLIDPEHDFFVRSDEDNLLYEHEKWIFIKIIEEKVRFYDELALYLRSFVKESRILTDLIAFQSFSMVTFDEAEEDAQQFSYNWVEIMNAIESKTNEYCLSEKNPYQIVRPARIKTKFTGTIEAGRKQLRIRYVEEILGSMIYKKSKTLVKLEDFSIV